MSIQTEAQLLHVLGKAIQLIKMYSSAQTVFLAEAEKAVNESIKAIDTTRHGPIARPSSIG